MNLINVRSRQPSLPMKPATTRSFLRPICKDANFVIRYTTDGTDPIASATAQTGPAFDGFFTPVSVQSWAAAWGTNSSVTIRAVACGRPIPTGLCPLLKRLRCHGPLNSPSCRLSFPAESHRPAGAARFFPTGSRSGRGDRTFYRSTARPPYRGAGWCSRSMIPRRRRSVRPFRTGSFTSSAQATGPAGFEQWFASPVASRSYNIVTVLNPDFVGANISGGDVNGSFRGSIFVSAPANFGIFNAGGQIVKGNLYLPGLPAIETPGSGNSTKTVVARGAAYVDSRLDSARTHRRQGIHRRRRVGRPATGHPPDCRSQRIRFADELHGQVDQEQFHRRENLPQR